MRQDHNQVSAQELRFAVAYAREPNVVQAALAAGYPRRIAMSVGISLLAKLGVQQIVLSHLRTEVEKAEFSENWGMNISDPTEALFDRIQAQRERLALEARGGLPLPSEIEIIRKTPSRHTCRAAHQLQEL